ncbi:hypothetical protein FAY30_26575 (plasmid) [Bacillus sp. S3]|uniref:competence protein CoiA family protein n=1 Tax=Bacillus sp. S3 TaxID=486398 RepID=UPI001187C5DD|nr:competence protein CoiA family protein [Bacillus sp. S3]QCJ45506.1 hypothetical protein FAY30_26575 [Bacillus sp. S3]
MAVKLHCAYDETGSLVFIKDRIEKNRIYYCPHCKEEVFSKKGSIREHHFSHKPDTECSANYETILHFEAKHYLAEKINDGEGIDLPFDLGKHIPALELLKNEAGISDHSIISLSEIISFYDVISASTETVIPGSQFIADIICLDKGDNKALACEVFVSHELDDEKIEFLKSNQFPYLELIPFHNEKGDIQFTLHSYYLPRFFERYKEKVDSTMLEQLFPLYKDELQKKVERFYEECEILKLKLLAVQALKKELQKEDSYNQLIASLDLHSYTSSAVAHRATVNRKELLDHLTYKKTAKGSYLMGRTTKDSYFVSSEQNQLYSIINQLVCQINISALIGGWENSSKESIVGFEFGIPQPSEISNVIRQVLIDKVEDYERRFQKKLTTLI